MLAIKPIKQAMLQSVERMPGVLAYGKSRRAQPAGFVLNTEN